MKIVKDATDYRVVMRRTFSGRYFVAQRRWMFLWWMDICDGGKRGPAGGLLPVHHATQDDAVRYIKKRFLADYSSLVVWQGSGLEVVEEVDKECEP